jgi:hypothetical protein
MFQIRLRPGLDDHAQYSIKTYWPFLRAWFERHLLSYVSGLAIDPWCDHRVLHEPFTALRQEITKANSKDPVEIRNGILRWRREFLLPLAQQLGFIDRVEMTVLQNCWRRDHFSYQKNAQRKLERPPEEEKELIFQRVQEIFHHFPSRTGKANYIDALAEPVQGVCRDRQTAEVVGREYNRIAERAAGLAQGILLAFIEHRELGILKHTQYEGADELLLLEGYRADVAEHSDDPEATLADLRRDVIAARRVLVEMNLWQQDVLHWPPYSYQRQQYVQRLTPERQDQVSQLLALSRNCTIEQAAGIFERLVRGGLPGLTAWRCVSFSQNVQQVQEAIEGRRLERKIGEHLGGLDAAQHVQVGDTIGHLKAAMEETQVGFSLSGVLGRSPYSPWRRRLGRNIWFGTPAMQRRRQRYRRQRRGVIRPRTIIALIEPDQDELVVRKVSPEDALVRAFARRANLVEAEARDIIRNLVTHGGHGVLLKSERFLNFLACIKDYVHFVRLAHPEGTVRLGSLWNRVNRIALDHGVTPLAINLVKSCFFSQPKPRRWHGGEGKALAGIHQNATPILNARRLHQTWQIIPVELPLVMVDEGHRIISRTCYVLVVMDVASERPVGAWACATEPGVEQVKLALYVAIWHPWIPDYPLRGVPARLDVPTALMKADEYAGDLQRAEYFLFTTVNISADIVWRGPRNPDDTDMAQRLRILGPQFIRTMFRANAVTCEQALEGVLTFLRDDKEAFPRHVPAEFPYGSPWCGLTMPGFDNPGAGWLLPERAETYVEEDGVRINGIVYRSEGAALAPGTRVWLRAFPYTYPGKEAGFFVRTEQGILRYVRAVGSGNGL